MYVHIPGGVDETPVEMTISASPGDAVKARVANGRAWVTGNQTAPPTDDTEAIRAKLKAIQAEKKAQTATESAEIAAQAAADATTSAGIAGRAASVAQAAAEAAQATADSKKVVFTSQPTPPYHVGDLWITGGVTYSDSMTDGTNDLITSEEELFQALILGEGQVTVYYCTFARAEGEEFSEADWSLAATDDTTVNELREWFWHDSTGAHILGDATGYRNDLNSTGMHIVDTSTETEVASFAADGAQIGADGETHTNISADGFEIYNSDEVIIFEAKDSGTSVTAPQETVYNVSMPQGENVTISGLADIPTEKFTAVVAVTYTYNGSTSSFTVSHIYTKGVSESYSPSAIKVGSLWFSYSGYYDGDQIMRVTARANGATGHHVTSRKLYSISYDLLIDAPYFSLGTRSGEPAPFSTIIGNALYATAAYQTSVGKYNLAEGNYVFCAGNGDDDDTRSNAATLDWSGNVVLAGGLTANADIEVTGGLSATGNVTAGGNMSATGNIAAGGDATITGDLTANSVATGSDIDWTELTLNSACTAYSTATTPHYKRRGDLVTLIGDVKPTAAVASGSTLTIGQLPAECCPPQRVSILCQGSTTAIWYCQIATDGTVTASRYRTEAGAQAMNTNTWLPFSITYMV